MVMTSTIYKQDGTELSAGLTPAGIDIRTWDYAIERAAELNECVILEDGGDYTVFTPNEDDGTCTFQTFEDACKFIAMRPSGMISIRCARESAGLTQAEAAQVVGIPYRTYQRWEANEGMLSVDKFFRALKALQEAK
jgi:DNA-binding transcriptional regulator YiaG